MIRQRFFTAALTASAFAALIFVAGCAKKAVQTPPTPPPTPPTQTTPSTTPTTPTTPPTTTPTLTEDEIIRTQLQPVFFALDSDRLDDAARAALDANARVMRDHSGLRVVVEGHCDERGTVEYNQALGERRAGAAREYLVGAGVDGSRLSMVSYGKERPFVEGSSEEAWSQNRRAHFSKP